MQRDTSDLRESLRLLKSYHGHGGGYVSWDARQEQGLAPLFDREERELAETLLALPDQEEVQREALNYIGPERAAKILKQVISLPQPPSGPTVWRLAPYLERHLDGLTWLLTELHIGLTGLIIETKLWTEWPATLSISQDLTKNAVSIQWGGFEQVTDDCGTCYFLRGMSLAMDAPTHVSSAWWTGTRLVQTHRSTYTTGVSPNAQRLHLTPAPLIRVKFPTEGSDSLTSKEYVLETSLCTIEIPKSRRINLTLGGRELNAT